MDYIKASLEMLPGPAALYDLSDLSLAEGNDAAIRFVQEKLGQATSREEARAKFGVEEILEQVATGVRQPGRQIDNGWLFASLMPAERMARPDLVLITVHCDVDEPTAQLDHRRMCLVLRVNETASLAIASLEAMIVQAKGAVMAQRSMVQAFNAETGELIRRNYAE